MKKSHTVLVSLSVLVVLAGCSTPNPYKKWYQGLENVQDVPGYCGRSEGVPTQIINISPERFEVVLQQMATEGYLAMGESSFIRYSAKADRWLQKWCRVIEADVAVSTSKYHHTESGYRTVYTPTFSTVTANSSVNLWNANNGNTSGSVSTQSFVSGSNSTVIPYSDRYDQYLAVYLARRQPGPVGVLFRPLTAQERRDSQSNIGVAVYETIVDSGAFKADILPGDVITHIDGHQVNGFESFKELLDATLQNSPSMIFTIRRGQETKQITVHKTENPGECRSMETTIASLGIKVDSVPKEQRLSRQTNAGALVTHVYEGTPAFAANVLEGDVILEWNGRKVSNWHHLQRLLDGQSIIGTTLKLLRNDKELEVKVY